MKENLQYEENQISSSTEQLKNDRKQLTVTLNDASVKAQELEEFKKKLEDNEKVLTDLRTNESQCENFKMLYKKLKL